MALEPGLTYHFECYSYNGANAAEFRYSVPAQILNWTTDGDMTQPAASTGILVRQSGTKTVEIECTFTAPPDRMTLLFRNTTNNPLSSVAIESGKKKLFHDQNIVYNQTIFTGFASATIPSSRLGVLPI